MRTILILTICIFIFGCSHQRNYVYSPEVPKDGFQKFLDYVNEFGSLQDKKEWAFINLKQHLAGGGIGDGYRWVSGYRLEDISDYEHHFKNYFGHRYKSLKQMERKWKNKPKPKGFDDFIIKCRSVTTFD